MAAKRLSSPPSASATLGQRVQEFLRGPSEPSVLAPTLTRTSTSLSPFTRSESELVLTKTKKVVFLGKTTIFTQIQRVEHAAAALSLSNAENVRLWVAANIKLALPEQNTKALSISEPDEPSEWRDEMADAMKKAVATSKGTPEYKRLASRSIGSLLQDLDRVLAPDYVPTDKDVLLSLPPTSNIVSASLRKTHVTFQLLDVGGRLHQRRKWTQCMVDAAAVMLCVSVADYDRFVRWRSADNQAVTSLQDSLLIAEELATRLLRSVPIFIVFTKADLLQQKLASAGHGFKTAFADYAGPDDSLQGALEHIKALFVKATRGGDVRFHMCCALETGDVSRVWMDVCSLLSR